MSEQPVATKAILYADGGFDLEKRIGGWGVHGYTYFDEEPKRGTGNPKAIPSDKGYIFEDNVGNKVTIAQYVDILGGGRDWGSNNEVEVIALIHALKWLKENPQITHVLIRSDSKFAIQGTTEWLEKWLKRNWMTPRGEPVKYRKTWEETKELYDGLMESMESLTINHVKGHSGDPGNSKADALATRGKVLGRNRDARIFTTVKEAQGYWKTASQCPRILQAPRWYFYTGDENHVREDGSHIYYVGCHGGKDKEDDLAGKPYADNFLGVVYVPEPEPVLEKLRVAAYDRDPLKHGKLVLGHLDAIFSPKTYQDLTEYGPTFLVSHKKRLDITDAKDNIIMTEQKPLGLGFRQVAMWESLSRHLDKVLGADSSHRITDLTDLLYEAQGKKQTLKLKPKYTQIVKYLDIDVEFNLEVSGDEPKPFIGNVRLIFGGDILTRNQLAAISEEVKSVKVVTWRESELVGRYATLVELTTGEIGLWARTEANLYYRQIG
jgi:ribonuclease HI